MIIDISYSFILIQEIIFPPNLNDVPDTISQRYQGSNLVGIVVGNYRVWRSSYLVALAPWQEDAVKRETMGTLTLGS